MLRHGLQFRYTKNLKETLMRVLFLVVLSLVFASCSSAKKDKKDIQEAAAQSSVTDSQSLGRTIQDHIENSQTLTEAQKEELRSILAANKKRAEELTEESYQFRGVLVTELLSGKATKRRVRILEKNIEKVEKMKLQNTFDTVKKISAIVSGQPDQSEFADEILNMENRGTSKR